MDTLQTQRVLGEAPRQVTVGGEALRGSSQQLSELWLNGLQSNGKTDWERKEIKPPDRQERQPIMAVPTPTTSPVLLRDFTAWRLKVDKDHTIYFSLKVQLFLWFCQAQPYVCAKEARLFERVEGDQKWTIPHVQMRTWAKEKWELCYWCCYFSQYIIKIYWDKIHLTQNNHLKQNNSVVFGTFILLCNHPLYLIAKYSIFITPRQSSKARKQLLPISPLPEASGNLPSVFSFYGFAYSGYFI